MMKSMGKFLLLTVGLLLVTGFFMYFFLKLTGLDSAEGLAQVQLFFEQQKWTFTAFRVSLLILVFWKWASFIHWLSRVFKMHNDDRDNIIRHRWPIMGWFVFFELMINQNLLGYLFN